MPLLVLHQLVITLAVDGQQDYLMQKITIGNNTNIGGVGHAQINKTMQLV